MKTLKEKILEILKGYYVNSLRPVSMKITSLVEKDYVEKEFVVWFTYDGIDRYNKENETLAEVYQYWLKNIKDK